MLARMYGPQSPAAHGVHFRRLSVAQLLRVGEAASIHQSDIVVLGCLQLFHKKRAGAWVQTEWGSCAKAWRSALLEHPAIRSTSICLPNGVSSDALRQSMRGLLCGTRHTKLVGMHRDTWGRHYWHLPPSYSSSSHVGDVGLGHSTPGPCVLNPPSYVEHILPNAVTVAEQR